MDINHEGIYFYILSGRNLADDIEEGEYLTGYEDVPKEKILEILTIYFGVDFGYDVKAWEKYIEDEGGWFYHFWEGGMYKLEASIL